MQTKQPDRQHVTIEPYVIQFRPPIDYGAARLAGKTIQFHATLKGIRKKELPELNDEFAQDLGDYRNIGEVRDAIRKELGSRKPLTAEAEIRAYFRKHVVPELEAIRQEEIGRQLFPAQYGYLQPGDEAIPARKS